MRQQLARMCQGERFLAVFFLSVATAMSTALGAGLFVVSWNSVAPALPADSQPFHWLARVERTCRVVNATCMPPVPAVGVATPGVVFTITTTYVLGDAPRMYERTLSEVAVQYPPYAFLEQYLLGAGSPGSVH